MPVFSIGGAVFVCTDLGSCSIGNFGTKDHHLLTGLGDYDHDQYLRKNGTQAMTGDLNISTFALKTTNLRLKEYTASLFAIRNAADDDSPVLW